MTDTIPVEKTPSVIIKSEDTAKIIPATVKKSDGGFDVNYTLPQPGQYAVKITSDQYPVAGPFAVEAVQIFQQVPPKGSQPATVGPPTAIPCQPLMPLVAAHNASLLKSGILNEPVPLHTGTIAPMQIVSPQITTPVSRSAATGPLQTPIGSRTNPDDIAPTQSKVPYLARTEESSDEQPMSSEGHHSSGPVNQPSEFRQHPVVPTQTSQQVNASRFAQPNFQSEKYQLDPILAEPGEFRKPRPPILPQEKVSSMYGMGI